MTFWDLLASCRRRWPLLVVGLILTSATGLWVKHEPGVYWAHTQDIFLAPSSTRFPNSLNAGSESLIMTAGIVAHEVTLGVSDSATSSAGVSLVDRGVSDGTMVRLPNIGGQWAYNYAQPVLDVEATAGTPDEVLRRMNALQLAIQTTLDRLQDSAKVDQFNRITLQPSPSSVEVMYREGDRRRALVVTSGLGLAITLSAIVVADRRRLGVRRIYVNQDPHSVSEPPLMSIAVSQGRPIVRSSGRPNGSAAQRSAHL